MGYKSISLLKIIEAINISLYLPHIQRPFVWDEEQMCRLFDSLMLNYPIQTFLFWRTKDAIKVRKFMTSIDWDADLSDYYDSSKSVKDVEKMFVLDGQQRLQTLYSLFNGAIKSSDSRANLEAYVDVTSGHTPGDGGLKYQLRFSKDPLGLPFYRIRDLRERHEQKNAEDIADELNSELDDIFNESTGAKHAREKQVRRNISQLTSLLREDTHFWVQELDGIANEYPYKRILDIFVRVNSGGTKLDAADLMFAAMKEGWSEIEENIERIVDLLNESRLGFDKGFVLKCVVVAHGKGAALEPEKFTSQEGELLLNSIKDNWDKTETTFMQLRDFIISELKLYGNRMVRSYSSFVPLFDYFYKNPKPDQRNRILMRGYYYKSQLFNWYGAQTDSIIDVMHGIVGKTLSSGFPIEKIKSYFEKSRGVDVELKMDHLDNMRLRFIILNLIYVEGFRESPFNVRFKGNEPHIDHIYPKSLLLRLGLTTEEINLIGNYRFVGATDNIRKRAESPQSYFSKLKEDGVDIQRHLLVTKVSKDPSLLKVDIKTYRDFRDKRLRAIFGIAEKVVNSELV